MLLKNKPVTEASQLSFDLDFRPAYGRDDFFVGRSNHEAIGSIDNWPNWGASPFLVIYGDEGAGKKHIAAVWQKKSDAIVLDANSFAAADLSKIISETPNIILHQLHLVLGDAELEEKLFHIYNAYINLADKKHVLMTSRFAPNALDITLPDLKSRLLASRNVKIDNPDDVLLLQVLGKQLSDMGFQPDEDLLNYTLRLMERSWTMPKRLAETINKMSLDKQKGLTKKMVREAISELEKNNPN